MEVWLQIIEIFWRSFSSNTMGWNLSRTSIHVSMHKHFLNYLLNFSHCPTFISLINGHACLFLLSYQPIFIYLIRLNRLKKVPILPLIKEIRDRLLVCISKKSDESAFTDLQIGFWDTCIVLADEQATAVRSIQNSTTKFLSRFMSLSHPILGI